MLRIVEEAARTDTGRQRHANEDSYFARSPVYVVADGMGGAQAGEVASKIATDAFDDEITLDDPERALAERAIEANRRIFDLARADESRTGMGTTLTGALLAADELSLVHVGDSRAYLFRDGVLRQLTRDHSLVEELRRQGRLTSEEAEEHPQRSIITRALGPEPDVELDIQTHQVRSGDVYLLCSDGLTSMVREERVRELLAQSPTLQEAVDRLVSEANHAGGRDNITVICFRVGGEPDGATEREEIDQTITSMNVRDLEPAAAAVAEPVDAQSTRDRERSQRRQPPKRRRWIKRTIVTVVVLVLLAAAAVGATLAIRSAYFIGQDSHGLVSLYRGVPYELPGGIKLYSEQYTSSVPTRSLSPLERQRLLDHQIRSRKDAADVIKQLERGEGDQ